MNRLLNDEMFPEEKQFSGGKIAMFMTQEEKARERGAVDGEGRGRGGGDGRAAQACRPKRAWDPLRRFPLRRGLGLLKDGLNAAALGAEAIESDMPGSSSSTRHRTGRTGRPQALEDGTPSGFAELPSMGLVSWRFN